MQTLQLKTCNEWTKAQDKDIEISGSTENDFEKKDFEHKLLSGFTMDDYKRPVTIKNTEYTITGFKPRTKYSVLLAYTYI